MFLKLLEKMLVFFLPVLLIPGCSIRESPKIKVGVGETIITPPAGTPMAGYNRTDVSKGVHDELYARSLVIEDENKMTVVLMTLGIINLDENYMDSIRDGINIQTGIPENNIVISCTHTHSGPLISGASEEYRRLLINRSIDSAVEAWKSRVPGRIGTGSTVELELGKNDRRMEYGGLHPDPKVGIIKIENAKGNLLGVAFNYGCHPSTLDLHNLEFTEDWPYYAIQGIKEYVGKDVWVAYYQSAQGDIKVGYTAELSAVGAEMGIRNFWYANIKGNGMSWAVLEALEGISTSGNPVIKAASGFFDYPLRESYPLSSEEAEKRYNAAKQKLAEMEKQSDTIGKRSMDKYRVDVFLTELALGCAQWVEKNPNPKPITMRQQAIRIGDAVFVTFPAEVFSEIGLKVKQSSPFEKTFILGLASGHGGYMPTADEYLEGGYAVVMTHFSPKCEQVCINASLDLIGKVKD
ncbi:MAG TPA: neutral/alkaline non-lysosomal ceramidase N-terminal domain-containing protein [Anaerolineae bacterium]|nr:neutral/alkaline non-lysosomal ceramidase N-terminal domain-containing protein [Anaerolineae bacterium]